jgi:hypothetical protein
MGRKSSDEVKAKSVKADHNGGIIYNIVKIINFYSL